MPTIGKIKDGSSSWGFVTYDYFIFSYQDGNNLVDVTFPSLLNESNIKWVREKDCWVFEGTIKFIEKDNSKAFQYLSSNYSSYSENAKLVRLELFFRDKMFLFHKDNPDILRMELEFSGEWNSDILCFLGRAEWRVLVKRNANFDNIWKNY